MKGLIDEECLFPMTFMIFVEIIGKPLSRELLYLHLCSNWMGESKREDYLLLCEGNSSKEVVRSVAEDPIPLNHRPTRSQVRRESSQVASSLLAV